MQYNSGVTCDYRRYKKAEEKKQFITKMKEQVWLIERLKKRIKILPYSIGELVLLNAQIVAMPYKLQKKLLREFHIVHPVLTRRKSLMRSYMYWPSMDHDIEKMVNEC